MSVICQDAGHEPIDAHVNELGNLLYHDLSVDSIFGLVELKLTLLFLSIEHELSGVDQALAHTKLKLAMLLARMVLVVLRAIRGVPMSILVLAPLFAPLEELKEL